MSAEPAPISILTDPDRLGALDATGLMDSPAEQEFDRVTDLVRRCLGVPVALVSLVETDRQFFKSQQGLAEPWCDARGTPLSHSFCQYVVTDDEPLVVEDAREHPVLKNNGAVAELDVVAYLGVPIRTPDGHTLGSLCAIDSVPRQWVQGDVEVMEALAEVVMVAVARRYRALPEPAAALFDLLGADIPYAAAVLDDRGRVLAANARALALAGLPPGLVVGRPLPSALPVFDGAEERLRRALAQVGSGQVARYEEAEFDGKTRAFEVALRPMPSGYVLFEAR
jgi:GAF domain-containing protein